MNILARAQFRDILDFNVASGILRLPIDISGDLMATAPTVPLIRAGAYVSLVLNTDLVFRDGRWNHTTATPVGKYGVNEFLLPFTGGRLGVSALLEGAAYCDRVDIGASCSADFLFGNSVNFLGAEVLDDQGDVIDGATISSRSGFDYRTGFQPAVVPLPAGALLSLTALVALAGLRHRRRAA